MLGKLILLKIGWLILKIFKSLAPNNHEPFTRNSFFIIQQPTILLLRDGTESMEGIGQIISNINAVEAVVDVVKTTLGPRGMDKMITTSKNTTISNDGATILGLLDIEHAAAKILVDIAKSQDN